MSGEETVYYQDDNVKITNARAVLGDKTYAMSNITSVSMGKQDPNNALGAVIMLLGIASFFCGFAFNRQWVLIIFGAVILVAGVVYIQKNKPTYTVRIGSASGEADALTSSDEEYIQKIVTAVNEAIVKRG